MKNYKLTPEAENFLQIIKNAPPLDFTDLEALKEVRRIRKKNYHHLVPLLDKIDNVQDITIESPDGTIPLRIYIPEGKGPFPVLLYLHEGGWVIGSVEECARECMAIAKRTPCIIVSAEYRLAPQYVYPSAHNDCYETLKWLREHAASFGGDRDKIAVGGLSAGGTMAIAITLRAIEEGGPPVKFVLPIHPATCISDKNTKSYRLFEKGYDISKADMDVLCPLYFPDKKEWEHPYVSPLLSKNLKNFPPALVLTAEVDILRDEGEAFAKKIVEEGGTAEYYRSKGNIHSLVSVEEIDKASHALREALK